MDLNELVFARLKSSARNSNEREIESRYPDIAKKIRIPGMYRDERVKNQKRYVLHVAIPSETVPRVHYDVVLAFESTPRSSTTDMRTWSLRFYSNSPYFTFEYGHIAHKQDLIPREVSKKLSLQARRNPPRKMNPDNTLAADKTIVFAALHLRDMRYLSVPMLEMAKPQKLRVPLMTRLVASSSDKLVQRQQAEQRMKKAQRRTQQRKTSKPASKAKSTFKPTTKPTTGKKYAGTRMKSMFKKKKSK